VLEALALREEPPDAGDFVDDTVPDVDEAAIQAFKVRALGSGALGDHWGGQAVRARHLLLVSLVYFCASALH
jgi:hypothetical protein